MLVIRSELEGLLADWEAGRLDAATLHAWAVARYTVPGVEPEDDVVNEVLSRLDALDVNLMTVADVPALRILLRSRPDLLEAAVLRYEEYADGLNFGERRRDLAGDPLDAKFCVDPRAERRQFLAGGLAA